MRHLFQTHFRKITHCNACGLVTYMRPVRVLSLQYAATVVALNIFTTSISFHIPISNDVQVINLPHPSCRHPCPERLLLMSLEKKSSKYRYYFAPLCDASNTKAGCLEPVLSVYKRRPHRNCILILNLSCLISAQHLSDVATVVRLLEWSVVSQMCCFFAYSSCNVLRARTCM